MSELLFLTFGANMKQLRQSRGLTIEEASKKCSLKARKRYFDLETNRCTPDLQEVHRICEYFVVNVSDMLYRPVYVEFRFINTNHPFPAR